MVESTRELADKVETRFYLTSLVWLAHQIGPVIRSHWAIENSLHWVMDMIFRDDECRVRTDHAPANFTTIKHMAHNLIRRAKGKDSFRLKRKIAAWDDDFLASLIAALFFHPIPLPRYPTGSEWRPRRSSDRPTPVRRKPESSKPESSRRTTLQSDSVIVRSVLTTFLA
jgi:hypothetical protein